MKIKNLIILILALLQATQIHASSQIYTTENSSLHSAARSNDIIKFRRLLNQKNFDQKNEFGFTPLHEASSEGNVEIIRLLLAIGANIHAKEDSASSMPLHLAARNGRDIAVKILLAAGAKPNAIDKNGWTALHEAVLALNNYEVIKALKLYGADFNAKTSNGKTPLALAKESGRSAQTNVEILRKLGAR